MVLMNNIIDVSRLHKDFYQYKVFSKGKLLTHALKDVSFQVKQGDFYGLLGRNGAGKSTLLRILTTNLEKSSGKVVINGVDLDKDIQSIKQTISWMFGVDYEGIGWSSVYSADAAIGASVPSWTNSMLATLVNGAFMYFVHSYYARPANERIVLSKTRFGSMEFCSSFSRFNIFACQFHPERSGPDGLKIYEALARAT